MRRSLAAVLIVVLMLLASSAWALSERDQAGIDTLLEETLASLTTQEPPLWELFSTQGSAALVQSDDGLTLGGRSDLKSDEEMAAAFSLPSGAQITGRSLQRAGEFVVGRVNIEAELPAPPMPMAAVRDLWSAYFRDGGDGFRKPRQPACGLVQPQKDEWLMTIGALQDGPENSWRYISLCLTPPRSEASAEDADAILHTFGAFERSIRSGDVTDLSGSLYNDPFVVAVYTPDGQGWFFVYPEYLTTMLSSALAMGATGDSRMSNPDIVVTGDVATVVAQWYLDIPALGPMDLGLTCSLVRENETWKIVSLCGGLLEQW